MSQKFKRMNLQERVQIEKYLDKGLSACSIAILLNRYKSTICREIQNTHYKSYSAFHSHMRSAKICSEKNYGRSKILSNKILLKYVLSKLRKKWSPEQISLSLKKKYPNEKSMQASHETIYFISTCTAKNHSRKNSLNSSAKSEKRADQDILKLSVM